VFYFSARRVDKAHYDHNSFSFNRLHVHKWCVDTLWTCVDAWTSCKSPPGKNFFSKKCETARQNGLKYCVVNRLRVSVGERDTTETNQGTFDAEQIQNAG